MEDLIDKNPGTMNTPKLPGKENEMNKAIRILLVDNHELVRQGLWRILESEEDIEVVGDCANAEEVFSMMVRLRPDMVLMDAQLPGMNGIEATRSLKGNELDYGADVIILANSTDYRAEAFEAGAASYLLKDTTRAELAQAVRQVYWNRHSPEEGDNFVEETVELVIPPPANAARLLRFMYQLEGVLHDYFASIVHTVGSWEYGTTITIQARPAVFSSLPIKLANMTEVEKVETEPLARSASSSFSKKFWSLPRLEISPSKSIRVTLKETAIAGTETHNHAELAQGAETASSGGSSREDSERAPSPSLAR